MAARGTASSATSEKSLSSGPRTRTCDIYKHENQQKDKGTSRERVKVSQICIKIQSEAKKVGLSSHGMSYPGVCLGGVVGKGAVLHRVKAQPRGRIHHT